MIYLCLVLADDNNLGTARLANPVAMRCLRAKTALTDRASSGSTASSTASSTVFERTGGVDADDVGSILVFPRSSCRLPPREACYDVDFLSDGARR